MPIALAHKLVRGLSEPPRRLDGLPEADGKSQVSIEYDGLPGLRHNSSSPTQHSLTGTKRHASKRSLRRSSSR